MGFPTEILEAPETVAGPVAVAPPARLRWIPIRSLAPRHRPRIASHLLTLPVSDRYLRFGHLATDAQIGRYVDLIDFERDEVFGVFNRRLELVALAHLATLAATAAMPAAAEFGVSVAPRLRGRGYGARLFDHAILHARNRRIDTLVIHALAENTAMLHIVRKAGAVIEHAGHETEARLKIGGDSLRSRVDALMGHHSAELDYGLKVQVRRVDAMVDALSEVGACIGKATSRPPER
jgi:GNAT superfamily N-acetyltransferase